ncbi:MAG: hypothetical protein HKM04_02710 [Legionellales bacterium]|nr:hypothetical protein [Legionellales bacterium]
MSSLFRKVIENNPVVAMKPVAPFKVANKTQAANQAEPVKNAAKKVSVNSVNDALRAERKAQRASFLGAAVGQEQQSFAGAKRLQNLRAHFDGPAKSSVNKI